MAAGDHIRVRRWGGLYCHHGIDMGDGTVVHFSGEPLSRKPASVCRESMEIFLQGGIEEVVAYSEDMVLRVPEETVRIAEAMLGAVDYDPLLNNCEHFACFCKTGVRRSRQVRKMIQAAATGGVLMVASAGMFVLSRAVKGQRLAGRG